MRWLSAGLIFVNVATLTALLLGFASGGLGHGIALFSFILAVFAAALAFHTTEAEQHARAGTALDAEGLWFWVIAGLFAIFALRSFCWLLYSDGDKLMVQSPNNLGDLSLHIAYIRTFANGISVWPDNPIYVFSKLRYPAGTDLFNGLLTLLHVDLIRGLVWAGLLGSLATFYALYKWGGNFAVAGFLFNGGLAGLQFFTNGQFLDYQGDKTIAWKSIPLAMFVTQRGLLYAVPAGLLLLCHWRALYFPAAARTEMTKPRQALPFWVELTLYASMPLFHVHTFLALSLVLGFWFVTGDNVRRKQIALLVGLAFIPASLIVFQITDHFQASSILSWQPGWLQNIGDFKMPFLKFWLMNFGVTLPLGLILLASLIWEAWSRRRWEGLRRSTALSFVVPAVGIFLFACLVKTAPWEWDNTKLFIWAYFLLLPFLWRDLISKFPPPAQVALCFALFASGFVTLFGGLSTGKPGYSLADRSEIDSVAQAVRKLPIEARFATYPTFNHPILLNGRKVVLGYPGHLWTQGFNYAETEAKLSALMRGGAGWQDIARFLKVRYIFWGSGEATNYTGSQRPWERTSRLIAQGSWGAIYDLEAVAASGTSR